MRSLSALLLVLVVAVWPGEAAAAGNWTWPVRGEVVTPFRVMPDSFAPGQHRGVDIAARVGTPVLAVAAGRVRFAGTVPGAGLAVTVRTADGRWDVSYLHLSDFSVQRGQVVAAEERLGASGRSGDPSSGRPHLHLGVRRAGRRGSYRDPLALLGAAPPAGGSRPVEAPPAPAGPGRGRDRPVALGRAPGGRRSPVRTPVPSLDPGRVPHAPAKPLPSPSRSPATAPRARPAAGLALGPVMALAGLALLAAAAIAAGGARARGIRLRGLAAGLRQALGARSGAG